MRDLKMIELSAQNIFGKEFTKLNKSEKCELFLRLAADFADECEANDSICDKFNDLTIDVVGLNC